MEEARVVPEGPVFEERPTELILREALVLGAAPLMLGAGFRALGQVLGVAALHYAGYACLALTVFVAFFFRNPQRFITGDERTVVAPADGRVLEADEVELEDGSKAVRVAIFLSLFNVHVNRAPVPGRVVAVEPSGSKFLAAFKGEASDRNVRCDMTLETDRGETVIVSQITGLIARRIACYPQVGDWLERGVRYGLIRFGSRTELVLPASAALRVKRGEPVRGGKSVIAQLPRDEL